MKYYSQIRNITLIIINLCEISCTNKNLWRQTGKQWDFNDAEQSFELLHLFYLGSKFEPIYRFPCENNHRVGLQAHLTDR